MSESVGRPENPLTDRESRIIEANAHLPESSAESEARSSTADSETLSECPNPDCDFTPEVADLTSDGTLYVAHEEDKVGMASRSPRGETDGCRIDAEHDYTL